jgi:hypothetical protein
MCKGRYFGLFCLRVGLGCRHGSWRSRYLLPAGRGSRQRRCQRLRQGTPWPNPGKPNRVDSKSRFDKAIESSRRATERKEQVL